MAVTQSHTLSIGIVGLPNSGKSTLFNSLTKKGVPAENFPFTTIDKNVGVVEVPDDRLKRLADLYKPPKIVPSAITFVDIAGLVEGASKGEGLGNQFLSHIREVDVIMYVVRAFESEIISHVYDRISPADDLEIVQSELILRDIQTVEMKLGDVRKRNRFGQDKVLNMQQSVLERTLAALNEGKPAVDLEMTEPEKEFMHEIWLLSAKPRMYVMNIREGMDQSVRDEWKQKLVDYAADSDKDFIMQVDVKLVGEMAEMSDEEKTEYVELLGFKPAQVEDVIKKAFERLRLITFYTGSEKEVNAWSIVEGTTVKESAGVIHTDLAQGFITADVVNVDDLITHGGFPQAKEVALVRNEGKGYLTKDGDYIIIHSNK